MIVADCTLLAYLLIEGEHTPTAEKIFQYDPEWCAPFLWRSEFRNVLVNHMLHRSLSLDQARIKMDEAESLLGNHSLAVNSLQVLEEAARRRITAYDSEYITLALNLRVPLVTFDRKLIASCPGTALSAKEFLASPS